MELLDEFGKVGAAAEQVLIKLAARQLTGFVKNLVGLLGSQLLLHDVAEAELHKPVHFQAGVVPEIRPAQIQVAQQFPVELVFALGFHLSLFRGVKYDERQYGTNLAKGQFTH